MAASGRYGVLFAGAMIASVAAGDAAADPAQTAPSTVQDTTYTPPSTDANAQVDIRALHKADAADASATADGSTAPAQPPKNPDGILNYRQNWAPAAVVTPKIGEPAQPGPGVLLPVRVEDQGLLMSWPTTTGIFTANMRRDQSDPDHPNRYVIELEGRNGVNSNNYEQRQVFWARAAFENGQLVDKDMQVPLAADTPQGREVYARLFTKFYNTGMDLAHSPLPGTSTVVNPIGYGSTGFNFSMPDQGLHGYAIGTVTGRDPNMQSHAVTVPVTVSDNDPGPYRARNETVFTDGAQIHLEGHYYDPSGARTEFSAEFLHTTGGAKPILERVDAWNVTKDADGRIVRQRVASINPGSDLAGPHAMDPGTVGFFKHNLVGMAIDTFDAANNHVPVAPGLTERGQSWANAWSDFHTNNPFTRMDHPIAGEAHSNTLGILAGTYHDPQAPKQPGRGGSTLGGLAGARP